MMRVNKDKKVKKKGEEKKKLTGILKKNISFKGCDDSVESVFGKKKIARPDVVRLISAYIREKELVQK